LSCPKIGIVGGVNHNPSFFCVLPTTSAKLPSIHFQLKRWKKVERHGSIMEITRNWPCSSYLPPPKVVLVRFGLLTWVWIGGMLGGRSVVARFPLTLWPLDASTSLVCSSAFILVEDW
jgi:hypothetical protein